METLLKGICNKRNFMDLLENFILFDESSGETRKIVARNHQFLGVNRAIEAVRDRENRQGKLGVFWHTQGAGKSYSMVMFTRKVHRKLGGNFTFVILTDRDDLDTQIYKTFAGCGVVDNDRDYHIITADKRLDQVARDFVQHYSTAWESGKAMLVCIDKITCVRMHRLIEFYWQERIKALEKQLDSITDEQEAILARRQIDWLRETKAAVVVSEEQGEVDKFRQWDLD